MSGVVGARHAVPLLPVHWSGSGEAPGVWVQSGQHYCRHNFRRADRAMPTYTYQCDSCGHGFEAVQRFADDPLTECPQCGASIRRVIQPVGVVFKGSGWYITDSRPKSQESNGNGSKSDAKPAADKSEAKTGAKSDVKTETIAEAKSE